MQIIETLYRKDITYRQAPQAVVRLSGDEWAGGYRQPQPDLIDQDYNRINLYQAWACAHLQVAPQASTSISLVTRIPTFGIASTSNNLQRVWTRVGIELRAGIRARLRPRARVKLWVDYFVEVWVR